MHRRSPSDQRRRELSQNLLTPSGAEQFLEHAPKSLELPVVEIGGGRGALTAKLLKWAPSLTVYELDTSFCLALSERFGDDPRFTLLQADFLEHSRLNGRYQVVANLPFSSSTAILRKLITEPVYVDSTLLVQFELAKKHTGAFGRWSLLTVLNWPTHSFAFHGRVSRQQFRPVPRVDGGIIRLERRAEPLLPPHITPHFRHDVELGFGGLGGSIGASLRQRYPRNRVSAALDAAHVSASTVVGFVTPTQWIEIVRELHKGSQNSPRRRT